MKTDCASAATHVKPKRRARQTLSDCVPTNWLDPLLTGHLAVLPRERAGAWNCRDIEALLRGIQDRIRAAENAK